MKLLILALCIAVSYAYDLHAKYQGDTFFNAWNFFTAGDPTHGTVDYVNQQTAQQKGYIKTQNNGTYIGCDTTTKATGRGRGSVRITTKEAFNQGLFIIDLTHMPTGCATWPAWWLVGPNWPNNGEIDIIEGVDKQATVATTLHTSNGCDMSSESSSLFTGHWGAAPGNKPATNCFVNAPGQYNNQGCGITGAANSYGAGFNNMGGGVFVTEWTNNFIRVFFFPRNNIPGDINNPNPDGWGKPYAYFTLGGNCAASHFKDMTGVINLTFCGDWAGATFGADCPGLGNCGDYVKNNPQAFKEAYWMINYVAIYK